MSLASVGVEQRLWKLDYSGVGKILTPIAARLSQVYNSVSTLSTAIIVLNGMCCRTINIRSTHTTFTLLIKMIHPCI